VIAKLQFLAHQAKTHEWDKRLETLWASIVDAHKGNDRDPLSRIEDALIKIRGVGECLNSVSQHAPEPAKVCVRIPTEVARCSGMISPGIPI
jgi:hypothetical protein